MWLFRLTINGSKYDGKLAFKKRKAKVSTASAAFAEAGTPVRKTRHKTVVDCDVEGGLNVGVRKVVQVVVHLVM